MSEERKISYQEALSALCAWEYMQSRARAGDSFWLTAFSDEGAWTMRDLAIRLGIWLQEVSGLVRAAMGEIDFERAFPSWDWNFVTVALEQFRFMAPDPVTFASGIIPAAEAAPALIFTARLKLGEQR